jgi:EAL domain-containing protein (putative c-di-GMP-specific phosphodiesterase class I)
MARLHDVATVEKEFERVLHDRLLRAVFQPIVSVETRAVVGYEGLVRGPAGSILESPSDLVKEAYRENRVVEFDWIARASASRAALQASLSPDDLLLLNIEPLAMASTGPPELWPVIEEAFHRFRIILEVTERSLDRDPRSLLEGIDRHRPTVSGLAMDDVGADIRALSLLPLLEPDVIKLDLKVIQGTPSPDAMKVLGIVYEEVERTGATVLAEGVETERHHDAVRQLGAPLAQGFLYGKPTDHPTTAQEHGSYKRLGPDVALEEVRSPFAALAGRTISRATEDLLAAFLKESFTHGLRMLEPALVILLVPDPKLLDRETLHVLSEVAQHGIVAAAFGPGVPPEPAPGVRGSWEHDPDLDGQWAHLALSPTTAVAILARRAPGTDSQFDFGVTHDRPRIIAAARCLLRQLGRQPGADSANA